MLLYILLLKTPSSPGSPGFTYGLLPRAVRQKTAPWVRICTQTGLESTFSRVGSENVSLEKRGQSHITGQHTRTGSQEVKCSAYKSAGVVVSQGLGVAKGFQQRVGLEDDVFDVLRGEGRNELCYGDRETARPRSQAAAYASGIFHSTVQYVCIHGHAHSDTQSLEDIIFPVSHEHVRST